MESNKAAKVGDALDIFARKMIAGIDDDVQEDLKKIAEETQQNQDWERRSLNDMNMINNFEELSFERIS